MIQELTVNEDGRFDVIEWRAVAVKPYPDSEEGAFPLHNNDCPYGGKASCVSRSGDSICGGFFGYAGEAVVRCTEEVK